MLNIENKGLFGEVVADAIARAHQTCESTVVRDKWVRAIAKAAATLDGDTTFIHWDEESKSLLFWSPASNNIYSANGVCQCKAFENGQPCYHRAMARLVRLYFERLGEPCRVAVYTDNFKGTSFVSKTEVYGVEKAKEVLERKIEGESCLAGAWVEDESGARIYDISDRIAAEAAEDFWGEPISVYTDEDALDDGFLLNVVAHGVKFNGRAVNRVTAGAAHAIGFEGKQDVTIKNNLQFIADKSEKDREGFDAWGIFEPDARLGDEKLWLVGNELGGYTLMLPSEY